MKTILFTLVFALTTAILTAQTEVAVLTEETTITVTVPVPSDQGSVFFTLHNQETFMKKGLVDLEAEILDGKATVTFENVPAGEYGVLLFHDKNGNKKMDFEPNGMPKEMYGVSNNVMSYGPPMWNDAKFEVTTESLALDIRM